MWVYFILCCMKIFHKANTNQYDLTWSSMWIIPNSREIPGSNINTFSLRALPYSHCKVLNSFLKQVASGDQQHLNQVWWNYKSVSSINRSEEILKSSKKIYEIHPFAITIPNLKTLSPNGFKRPNILFPPLQFCIFRLNFMPLNCSLWYLDQLYYTMGL